jgi:tRNA(adenine34) deaminase
VIAIRAAGQQLENYRLPDTTLYVTLEPCTMCAGLMIHARIKRLVFGANEPKTGACGSVFDVLGDERHNHQLEVEGGVMQEECVAIIQRFFAERRFLKKRLGSRI